VAEKIENLAIKGPVCFQEPVLKYDVTCQQAKLISLTYKVLTTSQPIYLCNLISLQTARNTRSSSVIALLVRPPPHLSENHWSSFSVCLASPLEPTSCFTSWTSFTSLCSTDLSLLHFLHLSPLHSFTV